MFRFGWLVLVIGAVAVSAQAEDALERASALFDGMEYPNALKLAEQILTSPSSGPTEMAGGYRIQGLCLAAAGKNDAALLAFRRLLAIDPAAQLSQDLSPKLTAPFYQAFAMTRNLKPIQLTHQPPEVGEVLGGTPLKLVLASDPLGMVKALRISYSSDADPRQQQLQVPVSTPVTKPQTVSLALPAGLRAREIRYRVEAVNEFGGVLVRLGQEGKPFQLKVRLTGVGVADGPKDVALPPPRASKESGPLPPPKRKGEGEADRAGAVVPWYQTWWFWTAVGVVVAGATTGTVLALTAGGETGPVDYGIRIR